MKKLLIYILAVALFAVGCKKTYNDTIGGQTPDERVAAAVAAYQKKLTSAPYGWIVVETTTGTAINGTTQDGPVSTFAYFMQFTDSNKVTMFSDFDTVMASVPKTSGYRVKALQRPALLFDTYSYIHVPTDPDNNISKSPFGTSYGWGADFEFSFADNVDPSKLGDTIKLTGNLNSASAVMVKATQAQRDAYFSGALKTTMNSLGNILTYFKRVTGTTLPFEMTPGASGAKSVVINWLDAANTFHSASSALYFTGTSVNLSSPVTIGTQTVNRFDNVVWNPGTSTITTSINGTIAATIASAIAPLKLNTTAAQSWYTQMGFNFNGCWVSDKAFHLNGVDDVCQFANVTAAGTTAVTKGSAQLWFAGAGVFGATAPYDGFITLVNNASLVSPYFVSDKPVTINGGIATFYYYGAAGTFTGSAGTLGYSMNAARSIVFYAVSGTRNIGNWYLIPTSTDGSTYDMVRVSDALAWISWRPR